MLATGGMVEARTSRTTGSAIGVGASSQVVKRRGRERIAASMGDGHGSLGEAYRENLVLSKQCVVRGGDAPAAAADALRWETSPGRRRYCRRAPRRAA